MTEWIHLFFVFDLMICGVIFLGVVVLNQKVETRKRTSLISLSVALFLGLVLPVLLIYLGFVILDKIDIEL